MPSRACHGGGQFQHAWPLCDLFVEVFLLLGQRKLGTHAVVFWVVIKGVPVMLFVIVLLLLLCMFCLRLLH